MSASKKIKKTSLNHHQYPFKFERALPGRGGEIYSTLMQSQHFDENNETTHRLIQSEYCIL